MEYAVSLAAWTQAVLINYTQTESDKLTIKDAIDDVEQRLTLDAHASAWVYYFFPFGTGC